MKKIPVNIMKGAESLIKIRENSDGVLLLHGFLGNPSEMKYLGEKIFQAGYSVYIPRYPGHGTSIHEMTMTDGDDWYRTAREAYLELKNHCERVSIVGLSMGGIFASLIASEFVLEKLCLISVPRKLKSFTVYLSPLICLFKKIIFTNDDKHGINWPEARASHVTYTEGIPVRQVWELHKLIKRAMRKLSGITVPVLIIQSDGDEVIPRDSAEYICSLLGSSEKEKIIFSRSGHVVTVDYDRDDASDAVVQFLSK